MSEKENPPAFPNTGNATWNLKPAEGMTLRDWFAGQAPITDKMAAYAMGCDDGIDLTDDSARASLCTVWAMMRYEYADAMLAARQNGGAA